MFLASALRRKTTLFHSCVITLGLFQFSACAVLQRTPAAITTEISVESEAFLREIDATVKKVVELREINTWAKAHGIRAWVAGGSAAGLCAYTRDDVRQRAAGKGEKGFSFDYDYYSIFRSTQDADVVIDADEKIAVELESFLQEKLGYLQGSKKIWEVRLLRETRGEGAGKKDALLSPDFQNQNSDSLSTGMVEITDPPPGESRVRDLFDWENQRSSAFLNDVLGGTITFHPRALHGETLRFQKGFNPEILSVLRYFVKAFQYSAEFRPEDHAAISERIHAFRIDATYTPEAVNYILSNALKLYQHSSDLERSRKVLDSFGLRTKLMAFAEKHLENHSSRSVRVLLDREPLRSAPLGTLDWFSDKGAKTAYWGKTAAELGITEVAHETRDFLAYENMTMSRKGQPNVFFSRDDAAGQGAGEAAVYGAGFYTAKGKKGARGTGLTIHYIVDPHAVEGRDFFIAQNSLADGSYIVFRNASALKTVSAELENIDMLDFLQLLKANRFDKNDLGVLEKLKLRVNKALSTKDEEKIESFIADEILKYLDDTKQPMAHVQFWENTAQGKRLLGKILGRFERKQALQYQYLQLFEESKRSLGVKGRMPGVTTSATQALYSAEVEPELQEWFFKVLAGDDGFRASFDFSAPWLVRFAKSHWEVVIREFAEPSRYRKKIKPWLGLIDRAYESGKMENPARLEAVIDEVLPVIRTSGGGIAFLVRHGYAERASVGVENFHYEMLLEIVDDLPKIPPAAVDKLIRDARSRWKNVYSILVWRGHWKEVLEVYAGVRNPDGSWIRDELKAEVKEMRRNEKMRIVSLGRDSWSSILVSAYVEATASGNPEDEKSARELLFRALRRESVSDQVITRMGWALKKAKLSLDLSAAKLTPVEKCKVLVQSLFR